MESEKLKILMDFSQFVVGTVGLGLVTTNINYHIQNREITIKEQASVGQFVQQALQEDVGVRRRFSQYFATVTRSDEMRNRWSEYAKNVEIEFTETEGKKKELQEKAKQEKNPTAKTQIIDQIDKLNIELSPNKVSSITANSARIYFHISSKNQNLIANSLASLLRENSYIVPNISITTSILKETQLRYFRESDKEEAESLISLLKSKGTNVVIKYLKGYEFSTRPRLYELWFSNKE